MTRRELLLAPLSLLALGSLGLSAYAGVIEPLLLTHVTRYKLRPKAWPDSLGLSIAVITDVHACEPWMTADRIEQIVQTTNALNADIIVLLGDYVAGHNKITGVVPNEVWARALSSLRAPLGIYAILGNHDWWADHEAQARRKGPAAARVALERVGIPVLENQSVKLTKGGESFWVAGLGDQLAFVRHHSGHMWSTQGVDDIATTLQSVSDEAPVILLAHEPDIFAKIPRRVALTLAGHTHGGQIRLFGIPPYAPSRLSRIYCYGHFEEADQHLIVSAGLGCSWWPVRFGVPPEIVHVQIGPDSLSPEKGSLS